MSFCLTLPLTRCACLSFCVRRPEASASGRSVELRVLLEAAPLACAARFASTEAGTWSRVGFGVGVGLGLGVGVRG